MEYENSAVNWAAYIESFSLVMKLEGLRPHTISSYVRDVRRMGELMEWQSPTLTCPPQTCPSERSDNGQNEGRQKCQEKVIARNKY